MRSTVMLGICRLGLGTCSSISAEPLPILPPPDGEKLLAGLTLAISDSHFQPPIEVTDPIRAPVNFTSPWMICIRGAQSEETRRITYTAFFKDGYTGSQYSAIMDSCAAQAYHSPKPSQKKRATETRELTRGPKLGALTAGWVAAE